jgi:hypothetical protein
MTALAIDTWQSLASKLGSAVDVERAAALLREAAVRAELLADNSRDVFEMNRRTGPDGLMAIRQMLEDVLRA